MFRINQRLDPQQLHAAFRASGRLHIPDFLDEEGAERLATFLREAQTWQLVLNAGDKLFELDRAAQDKLTAAQRAELEQAVHAQARYGFQYCYETIRVPDAEQERQARGTILDDFARFLSDQPALDFLRTVVGDPAIAFADVSCPLLSGPISILGMATKEEWNGKEAQAGRHHQQAA